MKRIDKMRYVHDKPEPVYEPRKWVKPSTEKQNPNQLSLFNEPKNVNKVEIDSLEDYYIHNESDEFEKVYTVKNRGGNKMAKSFPSYKEAVDYLNTLKEDVNTQARESVNKVEIEKLDKQIDSLEDEWDKLWNEDQKKNKMDLEEIDAVIKSLVLKRDELEFDSPLPF